VILLHGQRQNRNSGFVHAFVHVLFSVASSFFVLAHVQRRVGRQVGPETIASLPVSPKTIATGGASRSANQPVAYSCNHSITTPLQAPLSNLGYPERRNGWPAQRVLRM